MWTLIIIVLANGASSTGGSGSAISSLNFISQEECQTAASQLSGAGVIGDKGKPYQIIAKCVLRNTSAAGARR